jgi:F-type H+-transporting ATPase subunit b
MAATLPALIAAASAEGGGLADVNFGLTLWTIVLFGLFAAVLAKFGWGPLLRAIEEREQGIRGAVEGAQTAQAEALALIAQQKEILQQARREREELIKQAMEEARQMRTTLMAQARADSEQLLQRAKEQIERDTKAALQKLRAEVADLAVAAAGKIVVSSLTPEAQRKLVEEFIQKLPQTPS